MVYARIIYIFAALVTFFSMAPGTVQAKVVTERVDYSYGNVIFQGVLAYDDASSGRLPGVVVVHEWTGLNEHPINSAKKLAAMGYVAFAADMYGKGVLAKNNQEAAALAGPVRDDRQLMRGRALAAHEQLIKSGRVDPAKTFAMGYCFGGTAALEMARAGAPLLGVVSFHGGLGTPNTEDMKHFKGEVLALHGAEDPHVPPEEVAAFKKELADAGVEWTFVSFGKAVHSFTNPKANSDSARYNERAATQSWEYMKVFFQEVLEK